MMAGLSDSIESRLLNVHCAHCGWDDQRELNWLSLQRDMNCPACGGVIVLNTSERKREIAALRRQVQSLQKQLTSCIPAAHCMMQRTEPVARRGSPAPSAELSLMHAYRDSTGRHSNHSSSMRHTGRFRR